MKTITMETIFEKKGLTFGELVASVYDGCGKQSAPGIVRLAVNGRLVEFRRRERFVISERLQTKPRV